MNSPLHHHDHGAHAHSHPHAAPQAGTALGAWWQVQSFLALASWQRVLLLSPVLLLLWLGVWWASA